MPLALLIACGDSSDDVPAGGVGNEIDGFDASDEHPDFWSDYGSFLAGVTDHVHQQHPGVRVEFTGTFEGLTEGTLHDLRVWTALAGVVDVVGVTYYPGTTGFQVSPPEDVYADFDELALTFPDSPILLQEVGYCTTCRVRTPRRWRVRTSWVTSRSWSTCGRWGFAPTRGSTSRVW